MPWDFWLIFVALGVFLPWRGRERLRKLMQVPVVSSRERMALYLSTIAFQWLAAGMAVWRSRARGLSWEALGISGEPSMKVAAAAVVGGMTLAVLHWLNLRRASRMPEKRRAMAMSLARRVLPQSGAEMVSFLGLAVTAGICEEVLYRGFAMAALSRAGLAAGVTVILSSLLFGLAHLYQGRGGVIGTSVLGICFGLLRLAYDSVIPGVVAHAAVDVVAGLAGWKYLHGGEAGKAVDTELPAKKGLP